MDVADIQDIPLFDGLSKSQLGRIAGWADEVKVGAGSRLVKEGDFSYEFFIIEEGSAEVTHDGEKLADLGPGDFFGEIGLLETNRRTANVITTAPSRLIVMFGRDFRSMTDAIPSVAERIRHIMQERLRT